MSPAIDHGPPDSVRDGRRSRRSSRDEVAGRRAEPHADRVVGRPGVRAHVAARALVGGVVVGPAVEGDAPGARSSGSSRGCRSCGVRSVGPGPPRRVRAGRRGRHGRRSPTGSEIGPDGPGPPGTGAGGRGGVHPGRPGSSQHPGRTPSLGHPGDGGVHADGRDAGLRGGQSVTSTIPGGTISRPGEHRGELGAAAGGERGGAAAVGVRPGAHAGGQAGVVLVVADVVDRHHAARDERSR